MKVKILRNVVVGRKIEKAGTVLDVDRKTAGALVDGNFAEEYTYRPEDPAGLPGDRPTSPSGMVPGI